MNVWGWVAAVHVLCAVLWVGGMFFAYVVLRPSLSVLEPIQRIALHTQVFRRFFLVVWHAMPLILLTGFAMLFVEYGGMAHVGWNVHLMLLLGLIMNALRKHRAQVSVSVQQERCCLLQFSISTK